MTRSGAIWLRPRALQDVSKVDLRTTVLGEDISMPLMLDPCSFARMCDSQAELAVARAAGRAGTVYAIAGGASEKPADIAKVATGPLWYQLYMSPNDDQTRALLDRVEGAGYRTLCVTVDTMIKPYREIDLRNGVTLPVQITPKLLLAGMSRPRWAKDFLFGSSGSTYRLRAARSAYDNFAEAIMHIKSVTLTELGWLRERWRGPLVVKGIMRGDEVATMIDAGVDGFVVSNHGGRNLDGVPATIEVLPEVVAAAGGRAEVFLDGGIRRGTDVVKALALGARRRAHGPAVHVRSRRQRRGRRGAGVGADAQRDPPGHGVLRRAEHRRHRRLTGDCRLAGTVTGGCGGTTP